MALELTKIAAVFGNAWLMQTNHTCKMWYENYMAPLIYPAQAFHKGFFDVFTAHRGMSRETVFSASEFMNLLIKFSKGVSYEKSLLIKVVQNGL